MTSIDHADRPPAAELVGPIEDAGGPDLIQRPSAEIEHLDQTAAEASATGAKLVPVDHGSAELVEKPPVVVPVPVEGRLVEAERQPPAPPRPVLPGWLRSRDAFWSAVVWAAGRVAHLVAFHGLRLPLYWLRLCLRAPIGTGRALAVWFRWVSDSDGRAVRSNLASGPGIDPAVFYRITEQRRQMLTGRLIVSIAAGTFLLTGMWSFITYTTDWGFALGVAAVLALLGLVGRSADRPVTSRSVDSDSVPRLTADLILTALGSLGIAELNKAVRMDSATAVRFPAPITRDGPGFRADIDLPPGVTAGDVIERRDRLASGLRRPLGAVWPEAEHDTHAGRLTLWVGDRPMAKSKPVPWTLLKHGAVDLFAPFPIGVDPRGRPVEVTLMFALGVIGALPRMGKTALLRLLALAAALDPTCELHVYDLKGGADLLPLEPVAHRFRVGDEPEDLAYLRSDLRAIHADMARRYKVLRGLPRAVCPEGKITRALADQRHLGLFPVVVVIDECQLAFDGDPDTVALVTDLGKRGPAAGIIVLLATQRVDAQSLPTGISSNAVLRWCFKVTGQVENDMVLGTSAYKAGIRATMFARTDQGICYFAGEGADPVIARTAYLNAPTAETVVARARAARLAAGLLTGHAAGIEPEPDQADQSLLDHLAEVWPVAENGPAERVWWDELANRLAEVHPGLYAGWTGTQVSAAAKPQGLKSVQVKRWVDGRQVNRRGLARIAVADALSRRDPDQLDQAGEGWPQLPAPDPNNPDPPAPRPGYR